ncbi:MAG: riboflavin synthase, alpha subunit [Bacteroidota bacterium]
MEKVGGNLRVGVRSDISATLRPDQSVAHDGVCLTVTDIRDGMHFVTAVPETLQRTNIGLLKPGDRINLERATPLGERMDGHLVQGHVDTTGHCIRLDTLDGSWRFSFQYRLQPEYLLVDKCSVCVNGVSLTVIDPEDLSDGTARFSVAIIPYTWDHTSFQDLRPETLVNLEFDVIGKYVAKYLAHYAVRK